MSGSGAEEPGDDLALAGEYVLGVLEGPARRDAEARAARDRGFAGAIRFWEEKLAPLASLVPAVEPPAALWERLRRAIGGGWVERRLVRRWQMVSAAGFALAAGIGVIAVLPRTAPVVAVASLSPLNAAPTGFVAQVRSDGSISVRPLAPGAVPSGRDYELWALPQGAKRPVPLGVLPVSGLVVPPGHLSAPGGKLLVSLEPKGGSPTGLPTGPVLYGGTIARL